VQFPRRGWVHRNVLPDASGAPNWLTLPLEKAPQEVLIRDLRFPPDADRELASRLRKFPLKARDPEAVQPILEALYEVRGTPLDYIEHLLELTAIYCGLQWRTLRSSSLRVPDAFRGQDRIIEIARRLGARRYVNAPGGRALYNAATFDNAGIELCFLSDYTGPKASILSRMLSHDRDELARDISGPAKGNS
jgi:hypothetical protein